MLSYQHIYHAGNPADVHKHGLLAAMLERLTQKPKPLSYLETHSGRGAYDLGSAEALKTGEAEKGVLALRAAFPKGHPYLGALEAAGAAGLYPGSPMVAHALLRPGDSLHLAELHPREYAGLRDVMAHKAHLYHQDGFEMAQSLCPPEPRRGLMLIDPSWELKEDYTRLPRIIAQLHRKWNVGVIALWYPLLGDGRHAEMLDALEALELPKVLRHEVRFAPVRAGHGMQGSGMFVVNTPFGTQEAAAEITEIFRKAR